MYIDSVQSSDKRQYGDVIELLFMVDHESSPDFQFINIFDCLFVVRCGLSTTKHYLRNICE